MKYSNLQTLLQQEIQAKEFFHSLPQEVQERIGNQSEEIHSLENLRDYVVHLSYGNA